MPGARPVPPERPDPLPHHRLRIAHRHGLHAAIQPALAHLHAVGRQVEVRQGADPADDVVLRRGLEGDAAFQHDFQLDRLAVDGDARADPVLVRAQFADTLQGARPAGPVNAVRNAR
ncbi:hypothetical protein [Ramlibacter montanisoli]|uniref:Uncharacterized protein n=1 Tax=Ramlibacter montanisoli TaxID=2732512 RepID=A0A849KP78_9BURK|nr:hypothetical protein [Ramlibacter montanisoli]NNU43599.1 hypothetical protein [Ramlibacter montanisoli]